jgi:ribosomal protein L18
MASTPDITEAGRISSMEESRRGRKARAKLVEDEMRVAVRRTNQKRKAQSVARTRTADQHLQESLLKRIRDMWLLRYRF